MSADEWQAEQFEQARAHLRAVAYRMLGSRAEADDALQEAWIRFARADTSAVENLRGWLTTVVSRVCLDMLRGRQARREELGELTEVTLEERAGPESEALLADSVGVALLVVLERLSPAERLAFVLHDIFAVPFAEIAPIVERGEDATRQLASRARRRVRGAEPEVAAESMADQRRVVEAFLAASREGDFEALLAVLDPEVVFRADRGADLAPGALEITGAADVARTVLARGRPFAPFARAAVVDGHAGVVVLVDGRLRSVVKFTVARGRVVGMDLTLDPEKLRRLRL
ncbi:MAG TPA: sigma-70 family RNA polymerase sigma factor [Solirubrobacteraceae bacterium]|jgi:RNA polymerase sigma factor (sigma-70 family)|nr:sigma-70 family RNA polymerase sigma factor [Solirubrobacteraceae bacterium]